MKTHGKAKSLNNLGLSSKNLYENYLPKSSLIKLKEVTLFNLAVQARSRMAEKTMQQQLQREVPTSVKVAANINHHLPKPETDAITQDVGRSKKSEYELSQPYFNIFT